jgi:hypothetical protein
MKTLLLTIWLASGTRHVEPITEAECRSAIEQSRAVLVLGGTLADEEGTIVVRIACGDDDILLALPSSDMPCEVTS